MEQKQYYRIIYTSILDGLDHDYMNIGFESPEAAQREIDTLIREGERHKDMTDDDIRRMYENGIYMYASIVGRDFRILPIKIRKN